VPGAENRDLWHRPWSGAASGHLGSQKTGDRLAPGSEEVRVLAEDSEVIDDVEALSDSDVDELLVEEVSIDGMCGVY
jgi:mycofactocin precursor